MKSLVLRSLAGAFLAVNAFTFADGAMTGYKLEPLCDASQMNNPDRPYGLKGTYETAVTFGQSLGLPQATAGELANATRNAGSCSRSGGREFGGRGWRGGTSGCKPGILLRINDSMMRMIVNSN